MEEMHWRMGNIWSPNRALSQYELPACFQILDSMWDKAQMGIVDKFELKRGQPQHPASCWLVTLQIFEGKKLTK